MENVVLVVHLILSLCLIGIVLIQRSEGGGLGMGGGAGDAMSARGAATALTRLTWIFAVGFIITSITLTVLARREANVSSVVDNMSATETVDDTVSSPVLPSGESLLPPSATDAPIAPPSVE
ncbi:preprotein translocase subunit SecG [Celeribacter marinus]|uniref:preprotein translocase subunit SecG n=1 Tax=Celeribacter marinus TaxID=1397108 RepID=UPI003F6C2BD7